MISYRAVLNRTLSSVTVRDDEEQPERSTRDNRGGTNGHLGRHRRLTKRQDGAARIGAGKDERSR